jgi:hypothetical protein
MEHLTAETLARLVDDVPDTEEAGHLAACESCRSELAALRAQTDALGALPEIMPPGGDWQVLEARLRSEGLVRDAGLFQKLGLARTPGWMRAAAAALLFLSGVGTGAAVAGSPRSGADAPAPERTASVEEAASAVRAAEQRYVSAVSRYRELLSENGGEQPTDPLGRYAALEHLVLVSQAAVRQAPGDPFLNGFLASALAERDAAARLVSVSADNWF